MVMIVRHADILIIVLFDCLGSCGMTTDWTRCRDRSWRHPGAGCGGLGISAQPDSHQCVVTHENRTGCSCYKRLSRMDIPS